MIRCRPPSLVRPLSLSVVSALLLTACGDDIHSAGSSEGSTTETADPDDTTGVVATSGSDTTSSGETTDPTEGTTSSTGTPQTSSTGDDPSGSGSTSGGEVPVPVRFGFSHGEEWDVPHGGFTNRGIALPEGSAGSPGDYSWNTLDMTGDGIPDLVVTSYIDEHVEVLGGSDDPHWDVYPGSTNGFESPPLAWSVPSGGLTTGFVSTGLSGSSPGTNTWDTFDITGDGIPDLVVTTEYGDDGPQVFGYGTAPHWNVYEGSIDGFSATATVWPVPDGGQADRGFIRPGGIALGPGDESWRTFDIDADGLPDLVVNARRDEDDNQAVFGLGDAPHWNVYGGLVGGGFAATPTPWSLPEGGGSSSGFDAFNGYSLEPGGGSWYTRDIDGDGTVDLVLTSIRDDDESSRVFGYGETPHWNVYLGGDGGFAPTPTSWAVPEGGAPDRGFSSLKSNSAPKGGDSWDTLDLTADGIPDLVVMMHDKPGEVFGHGDEPYWNVFIGGENGFADTAAQWSVPLGGSVDRGFHAVDGRAYGKDDEAWHTVDLDGDGALDLVATGRISIEGGSLRALGYPVSPYWRVHYGTP